MQRVNMRRIKAFTRGLLHASGVSAVLARANRQPKILMYHGVTNAGAALFEAQLQYLKQRFRVVPLSVLVDPAETSRNVVAVTFDDGLRNNFSVVWPILKRLKIPATFFVCPGLIETGSWLWNHEAGARLRSLSKDARNEICSSAPSSDVTTFLEWMKTLPTSSRISMENQIREATPHFQPSTQQLAEHEIISWEELRNLDAELITIGSHGHSHKILTTLCSDELEAEIAYSRSVLEEKLDREINFFCYPNGACNQEIADIARLHYRAAVTTVESLVPANCDPLLLPRIPAAPDLPLFAWRLHQPQA